MLPEACLVVQSHLASVTIIEIVDCATQDAWVSYMRSETIMEKTQSVLTRRLPKSNLCEWCRNDGEIKLLTFWLE